MNELLRCVVLAALCCILTISLVERCSPRDDTDPAGGRSGMHLRTDALTGCQYLSEPRGGITPRVDRSGRHMGCK